MNSLYFLSRQLIYFLCAATLALLLSLQPAFPHCASNIFFHGVFVPLLLSFPLAIILSVTGKAASLESSERNFETICFSLIWVHQHGMAVRHLHACARDRRLNDEMRAKYLSMAATARRVI